MRLSGSVDFFKVLAVVAVVSGHAVIVEDKLLFSKFAMPEDGVWHFLVFLYAQVIRFAVPFFFILSGYLWGQKGKKGVLLNADSPIVVKRIKRIALVFAIWTAIYLFPFDYSFALFTAPLEVAKNAYWRLLALLNDPLRLVTEGSKVHLWYLVALIWAIAITALFAKQRTLKTLFLFSVALYFIGVFGKPYADTPLGFRSDFDTRNGPFFGTIFFVTGYGLAGLKRRESWRWIGALIFAFGFLIHMTELFLLWQNYKINLLQDYVFGTYFMGLGAALMALSKNGFSVDSRLVSNIGAFALGIYAIHYAYVEALRPIRHTFESPVWSITYVAAILLLSLATAKVMARYSTTRELVQ